jgi:streptomycin 3"-adenylyltransferase
MVAGVPDLLADLEWDTRNVLLTLARIWTTLATGVICSKDAAADWVLPHLAVKDRSVLARARAMYLGDHDERWDDLLPHVRSFADRVAGVIERLAARDRDGPQPRPGSTAGAGPGARAAALRAPYRVLLAAE